MKKIFVLIFICCTLTAFSQTKSLQFGLGSSFLGSGDIFTGVFEAELGYKLNPYLSTAFGINSAFGYRNSELREYTTYQQGNTNIYFSPFRNDRKVDFKLGTGFSANYVLDRRINYLSSFFPTYLNESRFSVGANMIIETTFALKNNFLLSLKGFIQPYANSDINSGILIKVGKVF